MSDDLVERLRNNRSCNFPETPCGAEEEFRNAFEAADRIEKLKADVLKYSGSVANAQMHNEELNRALNRVIDRWEEQSIRVERLEAALQAVIRYAGSAGDDYLANQARKALEGKDE